MTPFRLRMLALLLPLGAAACAGPRDEVAVTSAAPADAEPGTIAGHRVAGDGRACAWATDVRDWRAVDQDHIVMETFGRSYLLRIGGACGGDPGGALAIGIGSTAGSVCPGDALIVEGRRCLIQAMWELPRDAAASR